ncbi:MAG: hypothetical protein ICV78_05245 [Tolypothrix sp. Co-bin9]|jgi:hypothetical protein|nr:hypothetical protein [Tolypothrix sp. Co-bin9]
MNEKISSSIHTSLINSPGVEDSTKPLLGCDGDYPFILSSPEVKTSLSAAFRF